MATLDAVLNARDTHHLVLCVCVCVTLLNIKTHYFEFWQVLVNAQIRTLSFFLEMWISSHFFFRLSYLPKKRNKIKIKIPRLFLG